VELASAVEPVAIAVSATDVYWTDFNLGVERVPIAGGATSLFYATTEAGAIAVDASHVYFSATYDLWKATFVGGQLLKLASGGSVTLAHGMAVDATNVYWGDSSTGTVQKAALDGGGATVMASGLFFPRAVVVDATKVYWGNGADDGTIQAVPIAGGLPVTLATAQDAPLTIAADATNLYWTDSAPDAAAPAVMTVPKAGGNAKALAAMGLTSPQSVALDSAYVYWSDADTGEVRRLPKGGGAAETVVSGQTGLVDIAVDAAAVYWALVNGNGKIMKLAK
jgi:hypothetical protein